MFEVTQPRVNCYRVGIRMNEPRMAALLVSHGRPGFYFRVLEEGEVGAGDEIMKVKAGPERVTVAEINALLYLPGHPASGLKRAVRIPALSAAWRTSLEALLVFVDRVQVGFSEIAVNPIGTGVDQRDQIFADRGVITELRQQVGHGPLTGERISVRCRLTRAHIHRAEMPRSSCSCSRSLRTQWENIGRVAYCKVKFQLPVLNDGGFFICSGNKILRNDDIVSEFWPICEHRGTSPAYHVSQVPPAAH